jgi:hypothetical protein
MPFVWLNLLAGAWCVLIPLPLPILLFILYRSDATLALSKTLRLTAAGAAIAQALLFTGPHALVLLSRFYRSLLQIQWGVGATTAARFWDWLRESRSWMTAGRPLLALAAEVAFIMLLVALYRYRQEPGEGVQRRSSILREAAAWTTGVAGLALVATVAGAVMTSIAYLRMNAASRWQTFGDMTLLMLVLRQVLSLVRALLFALLPVLILKSQPAECETPAEIGAA